MINLYQVKYWIADCGTETAQALRDGLIANVKKTGSYIVKIDRFSGDSGQTYFQIHADDGQGCAPEGLPTQADDMAIHLIKAHGWDDEEARLWLKKQIEEEAFYDPE